MHTIAELFTAGLSMYVLSYVVVIFDARTGKLLRMIAYLNGMAIIVIISSYVGAFAAKIMQAIDKIPM